MTISPEVHQRFVDELTVAFGGRVDSVDVIPDAQYPNEHNVLAKRGEEYLSVSVSDDVFEDDAHRPIWVGLIVDTMIGGVGGVAGPEPLLP